MLQKTNFNYSTFALMRKGNRRRENQLLYPCFLSFLKEQNGTFAVYCKCRQGMAAFLYSFHRDRRLSTPECHRRRNFSWQNVFSKYGAVSRRLCASHHCPPSVRKRSRMLHRTLITKRRWIGRPPKALHRARTRTDFRRTSCARVHRRSRSCGGQTARLRSAGTIRSQM